MRSEELALKWAPGGPIELAMMRYSKALREAASAEEELTGSLLSEGDVFAEALVGRADRVDSLLISSAAKKLPEANS
jgi:hypothetical protein